jgi:aromatic-amino-acid transaminase
MFDAQGGLDVPALDKALGEVERALVFLNDPCHNPTGFSMSPAEWQQVVEVIGRHAEKKPVTLLVDCAYYLYGAGDPRAFLAHLLPLIGKAPILFAWSASKSFTHYGLRVGSLIACVADAKERAAVENALCYSSRGTWSNCNRGGLSAVTRLLGELRGECDREREVLKAKLRARVDAFNRLAQKKGLKYPRYEGGFFVTVFSDDAQAHTLRMKEKGVFVVPQKGAVRVALCSVAEKDVERLVDAL